jgi:O-antigen ligase
MGGARVAPGAVRTPARHPANRGQVSAPSDSLSLDPLRVAIFLLILIALSRIHIHLGLTQLRPALVLAVGAGVYAFFNPRLINTRKLLSYWPAKVIVALAILAWPSAVFGISLGGAVMYILNDYSKVLILTFLLVVAIRTPRDLRFFIWAYAISCAVLAYYALLVFEPYRSRGNEAIRLGSMYSYDSNDIGCILMSGLPLAILLFQTSRSKGKFLAGVVMMSIGATAAMSGSRGAFLGLLAVGFMLLVFLPRVPVVKRFGFVLVVLIGLIAVAPQGYWGQMATVFSPQEDYNWTNYYGRKQTAERAIGYMLQYPLFGLGINNFSRAEGTISNRAVTFVDRSGYASRWRAAHNSFLQAGSELGFPGLFLWSGLVLGGIIGLHRLRKRLPSAWLDDHGSKRFIYLSTVYLPIAMVGFASTSFFVTFAWIDPVYILSAFIIGVYVCANQLLQAEFSASAPPLAKHPVRLRRPAAVRVARPT